MNWGLHGMVLKSITDLITGEGREVIRECRHCGETIDDESDECPHCGPDTDIVTYEL